MQISTHRVDVMGYHSTKSAEGERRDQSVPELSYGIVTWSKTEAERGRGPAEGMGTGDGTENAQGSSEASAAAAAPQDVSSRMTMSGWCLLIALI